MRRFLPAILIIALTGLIASPRGLDAHHTEGHDAAPYIVGGTAGAAAIGGVIFYLASSSHRKERWVKKFREENRHREKDGLSPLSFCEELYKQNRSWAKKDPECPRTPLLP